MSPAYCRSSRRQVRARLAVRRSGRERSRRGNLFVQDGEDDHSLIRNRHREIRKADLAASPRACVIENSIVDARARAKSKMIGRLGPHAILLFRNRWHKLRNRCPPREKAQSPREAFNKKELDLRVREITANILTKVNHSCLRHFPPSRHFVVTSGEQTAQERPSAL